MFEGFVKFKPTVGGFIGELIKKFDVADGALLPHAVKN